MCCLPKGAAFFIKPLNFCNFGPRPCLYLLRPWPCLYLRGLPPAPVGTSDCIMFYLLLPSNPNSIGAATEAANKPNAPPVLHLLLPVSFMETLLLELLIHSTFVLVLMLLIAIQERPTPSCRNYR